MLNPRFYVELPHVGRAYDVDYPEMVSNVYVNIARVGVKGKDEARFSREHEVAHLHFLPLGVDVLVAHEKRRLEQGAEPGYETS